MSNWKPCKCWEQIDAELKKEGFMISDDLKCPRIDPRATKAIGVSRILPLKRLDGKRLGRGDTKAIIISHCPFCGTPLEEETKEEA